jgi:hypothetical protein
MRSSAVGLRNLFRARALEPRHRLLSWRASDPSPNRSCHPVGLPLQERLEVIGNVHLRSRLSDGIVRRRHRMLSDLRIEYDDASFPRDEAGHHRALALACPNRYDVSCDGVALPGGSHQDIMVEIAPPSATPTNLLN